MFTEVSKQRRTLRRPQHTWHVRAKPWVVQPCMIAPILPGESLESLVFQVRGVTDPIKNPLIGWWMEHYFFYVRLRALDDLMETMLLYPGTDVSSLNAAADVDTYHQGGTIDFAGRCRDHIVDEFFRDEGETASSHVVDSNPIASLGSDLGLHTILNDADYTSEDPTLAVGVDDQVTGREIMELLKQWQQERNADVSDLTFENWARTLGVQIQDTPSRPELVRYSRAWQYPSNTVDPADGSVASAVSWAISERASKKRYFNEPGFLVGLTVVRPKVYISAQKGALAHEYTFSEAWVPRSMGIDPMTETLKKYATGAGPFQSVTDDYWIDLRDLLFYGDQFINFALTATDAGMVALPTAGLEKRYVASTDIDALFVDAVGGNNLVRQDGVASLGVRTTAVGDRTPTNRV